jgi:hypothetical protein
MPVDRLTAQAAGAELVRLYQALELELAHGVARRLVQGIDEQDWAGRKLAAAGELRTWAQRLVQRVTANATGRVVGAVTRAFLAGGAALDKELAHGTRAGDLAAATKQLPNQRTIGVLARALTMRMDSAGLQVVRSTVDAYRQVIATTAATVAGGATTRRDAAQRAYGKLINEGLTGFTDVRGRRWSLSGYVDMATRTTVAQAAVQGQLDRQADLGLDLVIVSNAPQECKLCQPWEGKILTRDESGRGGRDIRAEHAIEDRTITVHVAGSVSEALAAGLMHPNCRHSFSAYLPGLTKAPTNTADPEGDAARQKLRALERATRDAKLRQAGALTPEAKRAAAAHVRDLQGKIRAHVAKHDLTRRTDREAPNLGLDRARPAAPAPPAGPPAPQAAARPVPRPRYEGRIDPELSLHEAATVRKTLDRQAELTPETLKKLHGVERASPEDMSKLSPGAVAFYQARTIFIPDGSLGDRIHEVGLRCMDSGWWSKCPRVDAGAGHVLAHEYGHHVHRFGMSAFVDSADVAKVWDALADELGVPAPRKQVDRNSGDVTVFVDTWLEINRALIAREVSTYGASSDGELMAEIWAEYSNMGDQARPLMRRVGAMMREIAERRSAR